MNDDIQIMLWSRYQMMATVDRALRKNRITCEVLGEKMCFLDKSCLIYPSWLGGRMKVAVLKQRCQMRDMCNRGPGMGDVRLPFTGDKSKTFMSVIAAASGL